MTPEGESIVPPSSKDTGLGLLTVIPWVTTIGLALLCAWLGQLYLVLRSESILLRDQVALDRVTLAMLQQQLEAERIISAAEIAQLKPAGGK